MWIIRIEPEKFENRGYSLINGAPSGGNVSNGSVPLVPARAAACASCPRGCRMRLASADSNESVCAGSMFVRIGGGGFGPPMGSAGANAMPAILSGKLTRQGNDLMQRYGLGHWQLMATQAYIQYLERAGIIGKGKEIDPDLPPQGTSAYYEALFRKLSLREGKFGELAAEAAARMAEKLGRYKEDVNSGNAPIVLLGNTGTLLFTGRGGVGLRFSSGRTRPDAAHDGQLSSSLDGIIGKSLPDR